MEIQIQHTDPVLLVGDSDLIACITVCLLNAGHHVEVCTNDGNDLRKRVNEHLSAQGKPVTYDKLMVNTVLHNQVSAKLLIVVSHENFEAKLSALQDIKPHITKDTVVAINTESIELSALNAGFADGQLIGLNWTEPVHTTFFLEIIAGNRDNANAQAVFKLAKEFWGKDPYTVVDEGIRGRLVSAMAREAAFLVDNGYASVEDIDRACRNDAGYYLPFCGNFRYMDLMGTYAYGMVMKDLNPDLSKSEELPGFIEQVLKDGGQGMKNKKGFYNYPNGEVEKWKETMDKFSYEIQAIIEKYPFNYQK